MAKKITSFDVAKLAGVSRATVSYVLNNVSSETIRPETREKVLKAAEELGYVPDTAARSLASRRTRNIAIAAEENQVTHPFLQRLIGGLLETVRENDLRLIVDTLPAGRTGEHILNHCRARSIDGIVMFNTLREDRTLKQLEKERFPLVLIGESSGLDITTVDNDNRTWARRATEHLLEQGCRRIVHPASAPPEYSAVTEQMTGWREALESAGLTPGEDLVGNASFDEESGYRVMKELLKQEPDGCFAGNDIVALGAMRAILETGRKIPEDIALIGYDDEPFSTHLYPSLSTVHVDAAGMGRKAGELLVDLIGGSRKPGERFLVDSRLVIRESSRKSSR